MLADEVARREGFELGEGLQQRVAQIMAMRKGNVSKLYEKLGMALKRSA